MFRSSKNFFIRLLILLPVLTYGHSAVGQSQLGLGKLEMGVSGLELDNHKRLPVVIGDLPEAAKSVGITRNRLRTIVEVEFRKAGITPVLEDFASMPNYFYVSVNVTGPAFSVETHFQRLVVYEARGAWNNISASTWGRSGVGSHGGQSDYIVAGVVQFTQEFLSDYVKANKG